MPGEDISKQSSWAIGLTMIQIWCSLSGPALLASAPSNGLPALVEPCIFAIISIIVGLCTWRILARRLRFFSAAAFLVSTLCIFVDCLLFLSS